MQSEEHSQAMNHYVSALANAERLQLLAQLIEARRSIDELSAVTSLPPAAISRHLACLQELGLVEASQEQEPQIYTFKAKTMETIIKAQLHAQKTPVATPWDGMPEENQRRLSNLMASDGRLEYIPTQSKKVLPILEYVAASIEKDQEYTEKEINALLEVYTKDTSTLRRFLIEFRFLSRTRDGSRYWRK